MCALAWLCLNMYLIGYLFTHSRVSICQLLHSTRDCVSAEGCDNSYDKLSGCVCRGCRGVFLCTHAACEGRGVWVCVDWPVACEYLFTEQLLSQVHFNETTPIRVSVEGCECVDWCGCVRTSVYRTSSVTSSLHMGQYRYVSTHIHAHLHTHAHTHPSTHTRTHKCRRACACCYRTTSITRSFEMR